VEAGDLVRMCDCSAEPWFREDLGVVLGLFARDGLQFVRVQWAQGDADSTMGYDINILEVVSESG